MCLWIKREELDAVVDFLQVLLPELNEAPFFYPEYRSIAISRECKQSYNEYILYTLDSYIGTHAKENECTMEKLADYVSNADPWNDLGEIDFTHNIVLKSLRCIEYEMCPVKPSPYNVVDFMRKDFL